MCTHRVIVYYLEKLTYDPLFAFSNSIFDVKILVFVVSAF